MVKKGQLLFDVGHFVHVCGVRGVRCFLGETASLVVLELCVGRRERKLQSSD